MAAMDTTNLRIVFTVPASGRVLVRLAGVVTGATTYPQILLGVMQSSTVIGRVAPNGSTKGTAVASTHQTHEAVFVVSGLTPAASLTWDAAFACEVGIASTAIRAGGPNDTTTNNAYGAFCFEIWDA